MRHRIDIVQVAKTFSKECQLVNVTVEDVARISLEAYTQFFNQYVKPQIIRSAITYDRDDFAPFIWQGMKAAFDTFNPCKGTKFTSYLYSRVSYRLLDAWRDFFSQIGTPDVIAEEDVLPRNKDVLEEVSRDDGMDQFGRCLWLQNEPQLFMLLPLHTLGYTQREMARFMMKDEKTIRNWIAKLLNYTTLFHKMDNGK